LIDDARLFDGTGGYPDAGTFANWIEERRPGTSVTFDGDIIRCIFDTTEKARPGRPDDL
jgi:hypothetical protein